MRVANRVDECLHQILFGFRKSKIPDVAMRFFLKNDDAMRTPNGLHVRRQSARGLGATGYYKVRWRTFQTDAQDTPELVIAQQGK